MVWATGLPRSEESSSDHESCCWREDPDEVNKRGAGCRKNTEVLWWSYRLNQSIRDRSIIITHRARTLCCPRLAAHVHSLHPSLHLVCQVVSLRVFCSISSNTFTSSSLSSCPLSPRVQMPLYCRSPILISLYTACRLSTQIQMHI